MLFESPVIWLAYTMILVHGYLISRLACCTFLWPQDDLSETSKQTNVGLSLHRTSVCDSLEKLRGPETCKSQELLSSLNGADHSRSERKGGDVSTWCNAAASEVSRCWNRTHFSSQKWKLAARNSRNSLFNAERDPSFSTFWKLLSCKLVILGIFIHTLHQDSIDGWSVALKLYINQTKKKDILIYRCKQLVNKVSLSMQYCNAILTEFCLFFF